MGHVQFTEQRLFLRLVLAIAHAEAKERDLIAVPFAALAFQVAGVIPPLSFEVRMRIVVRRKHQFTAGQGELVGEGGSELLTLTLPLPGRERVRVRERQKETNAEIRFVLSFLSDCMIAVAFRLML